MPDYAVWRKRHWTPASRRQLRRWWKPAQPYRCESGKKSMAIRLQTLGSTVWIMVLIVVLLILLAGALYMAE
jgi:hypothetical protein